jgi:hypothetical protein
LTLVSHFASKIFLSKFTPYDFGLRNEEAAKSEGQRVKIKEQGVRVE